MASRLDRFAIENRKRHPSVLATLSAAASLPLFASAAVAAPASLCTTKETDLFSCPTHGKIVSVCGLSPGRAEYRFGRPGQIELQGRDLHIGEQSYSGDGEDQIYFQSNGYRYIVYDRTLRTGLGADGHNDPQTSSGLFVQKGGRTVSSTRCGSEGDQPVKTSEGERSYREAALSITNEMVADVDRPSPDVCGELRRPNL